MKYFVIVLKDEPRIEEHDTIFSAEESQQTIFEKTGELTKLIYGEDISGIIANFGHKKRMGMEQVKK